MSAGAAAAGGSAEAGIVGAVAAAWACAPDRVAAGARASGLLGPASQPRVPALDRARALRLAATRGAGGALLADPAIPLAAVALAVGFSDQPHVTGAFRRATGPTPGAWRRERAR